MSELHAAVKRQEIPAPIGAPDAAVLERAFREFNEVSQRLEKKYELLVRETESLRAQLREKDLAVKRAERLATLGETAAAIAHEVRNPLGAIKLFVSLLRREVSGKKGAGELVDQIDKSINHLDGVVSNILQFSRDRGMELSPVNLHAIIQERVCGFGSGAPASQFSVKLDLQAAPFLKGNEHGLRQVVYNLLLNAAQATRYRGEVCIATRDEGADKVVLTVHDNGPGIPDSVLGKIFEPFVTTRNEGTGLGLAIVQQIVEHHGGSITAANEGGAVFTITLPRNT